MDERYWLSPWGKTSRDDQGSVTGWLPLLQHLDDTAAVARRIVDEWLPRQVVSRVCDSMPGGEGTFRTLIFWLASVHDVGKASPAFAVQDRRLADRMSRFGLPVNPALAQDPNRAAVSHQLVGHSAVRSWLTKELFVVSGDIAVQLASIVGSHHGVAPERTQLALVRQHPELSGGAVWQSARTEILRRATRRAAPELLAPLAGHRLDRPTMVLLSGLVIMADWIASNDDLFPMQELATMEDVPAEPDEDRTAERAAYGWSRLALPPRWVPAPADTDLTGTFRRRFPAIDVPRPVQVAAVELVRAEPEPGMLIIEAPMGVGKTEVSLVVAEEQARKSGAGGCVVALPTQATTDAMFGRIHQWLTALPRNESDIALTVALAHGKAMLNDEYAGLVRAGRFADIGENRERDSSETLIAHQWLSGRKKGPLASFLVCTIDQILVGALKSRHVMLRHLALAGKVVIIDEVHAYDVYMSQYLHRILRWLGAYHVPVVLLSATLPPVRRAELLSAYAEGRGREPVIPAVETVGYPAVISSTGTVRTVPAPAGATVRLDRLPDDPDTLVRYLRTKLADGGCAAVVRNTVTRVQETADRLIAEFGENAVTVNHSRFLACDRARIDRGLVRRFGPPGEGNDRRGPHIVVASQVLEQSLDVDFDVLVTDLAPADLLLQRIGRLHRHERTRPAGVSEPHCAITGVEDWAAAPVRAVSDVRRIYGEHTLLRSAALFAERDTVALPADIPEIVRDAYEDVPLGPASWQEAMVTAANAARLRAAERTSKAHTFILGDPHSVEPSLVGWLRAGVGDAEGPDGMAQVRDGEESLEVLVVQGDSDGGLLTPEWIERGGGQQLPLDEPLPHDLARIVAACALRLPLALSHGGVIDKVIASLENTKPTSFAVTRLLAGQLVLVLDQDRRAEILAGDATFALTYDPRRGLVHERI
ncbi:CRISPR-associated helicase/endonuclease Cas3 [Amycolatopsis antarctica]|uniref:CRISPR-associated helicase/endonuclease Cas3 n=1 Tax=Amycolatopsis antarctica TaxID=1854586 RepID=A0A263CZ64_9PSEU|nr:CRISPR-associated helicase/endonuclease Cas3 [Amycolatopsis antarctica]OZM71259.1 CRISPR-associated helicase/endonuclease Cas3 [Amycolatopsis antarctica]